eukprot:scaffold7384_cov396-Prasinococcus_capsulatus_cf.AAC.10
MRSWNCLSPPQLVGREPHARRRQRRQLLLLRSSRSPRGTIRVGTRIPAAVAPALACGAPDEWVAGL